jgi:NAD(P)-dependent dehydrogenase (short-subunit alcohol dehydrogenase family)
LPLVLPAPTTDGYEIQFGTNHLAHALLVRKLLPTLLHNASAPTSDVRIIFLTSAGFRNPPAGGIAFSTLKTAQDTGALGSWKRYGQSKLANILYSSEFSRRYPAVCAMSLHPGLGNTELVTQLPLLKRVFVYLGNLKVPEESRDMIHTQI